MKSRGFTIVELLVVIAMIAILAAMIVPVMLQAKEAARMKVCGQSLRQLGIGLSQYIDDNNGYGLPQSPPQFKNAWILWAEPIVRYIGVSASPFRNYKLPPPPGLSVSSPYQNESMNHQPKWLWVCPGDINRGARDDTASTGPKGKSFEPYWWYCGSSYMYPGPTAYLAGESEQQKAPPTPPRKPLTWRCLKRDILLADAWFDFHSGQRVPHDFGTIKPPSELVNMESETKSINILFLDLHLTSVTSVQREFYRRLTIFDDNPYYNGDESASHPK